MDRPNGGIEAVRQLTDEYPEIESDLLALYGFDVVEALYVTQTPSVIRRALTLIGRLHHQKHDSLYMARRVKEATAERDEQRAHARYLAIEAGEDPDDYDKELQALDFAEAEAAREDNPFEFFGWDTSLYKLNELINAVNLLRIQTIQLMAAGGEGLPEFQSSWTPGDEIKAPGADDAAQVIDFDDDNFSLASLPT